MKAIVRTKYGSPDILQFKEVEKPAPTDGRVLVEVHAASVNPADWHGMRGRPLFFRPMMGGF
jgi:NADPH:quinone reductase-like Zn-dependent oxidoreductase